MLITELAVKAVASLKIEDDLKQPDKAMSEVLNVRTKGNEGRGCSSSDSPNVEKAE